MKRYEPRSRVPAIAAIGSMLAATATIAVLVVLPATPAPAGDAGMLARARDAKPPIEVAINPSHIEVIGFRSARTALEPAAEPQARAKKS
jgi:hypothetical protein